MEFHVLTPDGDQLIMQTADGRRVARRVVLVLPAPASSLPPAAARTEPATSTEASSAASAD